MNSLELLMYGIRFVFVLLVCFVLKIMIFFSGLELTFIASFGALYFVVRNNHSPIKGYLKDED